MLLVLFLLHHSTPTTAITRGPGYVCSEAFPGTTESDLLALRLCNKTNSGPGFHSTEVARLAQTSVLQLKVGQCEELGGAGFRCLEHYQCLGEGATIAASGPSQTRVLAVQTNVTVHQSVPGSNLTYSYSILDALDTTCEAYTKVCCGPQLEEKVRRQAKKCDAGVQGLSIIDVITIRSPGTWQDDCREELTVEVKKSCTAASVVDLRSEEDSCRPVAKILDSCAAADVVNPETGAPCGTEVVRIPKSIGEVDHEELEEESRERCSAVQVIDIRTDEGEEEASRRCNPGGSQSTETRVMREEVYTPQCGQHNPQGFRQSIMNLDLSLQESQFGEWPHMCALLSPEGSYQCGASLLSPSTLLTAAHCATLPGWRVRCGDWNSASSLELLPHAEREVTRVTNHPDFNEKDKNFHNNLAVVEVVQAFQLAPHIDTICLPRPGQSFQEEECTATGWGKDVFGSTGQLQVILKEVVLPVVGNEQCQKLLRKTRLGRFFDLDPSFLCAGGEQGVDTCTGDGGSPLVCRDPGTGRLVQAGVVSVGLGCGQEGVPGLYGGVAGAVCWLVARVAEVEGSQYLGEQFPEC